MLNPFDREAFLSRSWQKTFRFLPAAADIDLPALEPDELAWLAMQPDVESRLVFTDRTGADIRYRLECGPFTDSQLRALPERDWTLLVQDVEKHLPDFRVYLDLVSFIPDWRIDDLMISCAAPGGGVGPHLDHYDVFLVQGVGRRRWRIGNPGDAVPEESSTALSLVQPFDAAAEYAAKSGDVLYLPPGVPHWGTAEAMCMTMSIGCRAPSQRELTLGQERVLGTTAAEPSGEDNGAFYSDDDLAACEAAPGKIDPATIRRIRQQSLLTNDLADAELARVFGSVVTDPKAWLLSEPMDRSAMTLRMQADDKLIVHGMARVAWFSQSDWHFVFVNGADREAGSHDLQVVQDICAQRCLTMAGWERLTSSADGESLLAWMGSEGLFDAGQGSE